MGCKGLRESKGREEAWQWKEKRKEGKKERGIEWGPQSHMKMYNVDFGPQGKM